MAAIADRVHLLVINRFGRAGSLGRGLLGCFAAALEVGVPVLTAVRGPYAEAWRAFRGELGQGLPADGSRVIAWAMRSIRRPEALEAKDPAVFSSLSEVPGRPPRDSGPRPGTIPLHFATILGIFQG